MVAESSGVATLLNTERIQRDNTAQPENNRRADEQESLARSVSDVATFSAEALALSREVIPPGESSEQGASEPQGRGQEASPADAAVSIDIRV